MNEIMLEETIVKEKDKDKEKDVEAKLLEIKETIKSYHFISAV